MKYEISMYVIGIYEIIMRKVIFLTQNASPEEQDNLPSLSEMYWVGQRKESGLMFASIGV